MICVPVALRVRIVALVRLFAEQTRRSMILFPPHDSKESHRGSIYGRGILGIGSFLQGLLLNYVLML